MAGRPWEDKEQWAAMSIKRRYLVLAPIIIALAVSLFLKIEILSHRSSSPPVTYCVPDSGTLPMNGVLMTCYSGTSTSTTG